MGTVPLPRHHTFNQINTVFMMKTDTAAASSHFSNVMLTGTILLANVDVNGLLDYGLKAFLGGAVWLGYKLAADYLDKKRKSKDNELN
jgi:hypothetical protein